VSPLNAFAASPPDPFAVAADRLDPRPHPYRDRRRDFVRECFTWEPGEGPTPYQDEVLAKLDEGRRVALRGPHGIGKTGLLAWVVIHFWVTRDGTDWKCPTTASAWRQLTKYLWPEIHKWLRRARWDVIGRRPIVDRTELLDLSMKGRTGEAFAVASNVPALIEGAHADHLLYVFDEAKAIPPETFDAAEGAFSGTGEALALAASTPGEPNGRFYEICTRKAGLEDWSVRHVTLEEAIAAGRVSREWAEQRRRQWGEHSAVYQNRVEGNFAASDEDGVIPLAWVEAANERWHAWDEAGRPGEFKGVGVDVARGGADETVLAPVYATEDLDAVAELRRYNERDTMAVAGRVGGLLSAAGRGFASVDVVGIGAGVVDRLRETHQLWAIVAFNASEATTRRDSSGELGFVNVRSAAWWGLRELLDPGGAAAQAGRHVALPPDDELTGDLVAPHWRVRSGGLIAVESKDDIRKRIRRSTDAGDAVVQVFFGEGGMPVVLPAEAHRGETITGDLLKVSF
jgi:hypothetical protein